LPFLYIQSTLKGVLINWRTSFFFIAVFSFLLTLLSWTYIQNVPPGIVAASEEGQRKDFPVKQGFIDLMKTPFFWVMVFAFEAYQQAFGLCLSSLAVSLVLSF